MTLYSVLKEMFDPEYGFAYVTGSQHYVSGNPNSLEFYIMERKDSKKVEIVNQAKKPKAIPNLRRIIEFIGKQTGKNTREPRGPSQ